MAGDTLRGSPTAQDVIAQGPQHQGQIAEQLLGGGIVLARRWAQARAIMGSAHVT